MNSTRRHSALAASVLLLLVSVIPEAAAKRPTPTPPPPGGPPAPILVAPASGASLVQPVLVDWNAVVDPGGPIGSYTWQVGTTSAFTTIIASGFTNMDSDPNVPTSTEDKLSGLPNGTYFWRVKATQLTPTGGVDSAWSLVRTLTVTGPGPAPATPAFITPANNAQFHPLESYKIQWSEVTGAQYYVLEADDEPSFSYPFTLTQSPITLVLAVWRRLGQYAHGLLSHPRSFGGRGAQSSFRGAHGSYHEHGAGVGRTLAPRARDRGDGRDSFLLRLGRHG